MAGDRRRHHRRALWCDVGARDRGTAGRQRAHAGDCRGDPDRRQGLSEPSIHRHCDGRRSTAGSARADTQLGHGRRLRGRGAAVGTGRLYRHEHFGARECAHGAGGAPGAECGAVGGISRRRGDRHARGGSRATRRDRLFRAPARPARGSGGAACARGSGFRRLADLDFCASGRWHIHQGCRRRRGSGRQGRGRNSRG